MFELPKIKTLWNNLTEGPFSFNDAWVDSRNNQYNKGINDGMHLTIWIRRRTDLPLTDRIGQPGKLELEFKNSKLYSFSKSETSFALVYDDTKYYTELKEYICDKLDSRFASIGNIWISHIGSNAGLRWHVDNDCALRYLYAINSNSKDYDVHFRNSTVNLNEGQSFMFNPSANEHKIETIYGPRTTLIVHLEST